LTERSKLRVQNFLADIETRLSQNEFVVGRRFSVADITAPVAAVSGRPSMAA
jgi:glutathione S-transferase